MGIVFLLYLNAPFSFCLKWYPVESSATAHMLSQLTKTINVALKSTKEERALLRARSALQRFPVIEWRQRIEDFHKRSIIASRYLAGDNALRELEYDVRMAGLLASLGDYNPSILSRPSHPASVINCKVDSTREPNGLGTQPRAGLSPVASEQQMQETSRQSDDDQHPSESASRPIYSINGSIDGHGQFSFPTSDVPLSSYGEFLQKANRTIIHAKKLGPAFSPAITPAGSLHSDSRLSSVESIAFIVEQKPNSHLNHAIASVSTPFIFSSFFLYDHYRSSLMPMGK
jgi:alpha-1,3-glucan synthase